MDFAELIIGAVLGAVFSDVLKGFYGRRIEKTFKNLVRFLRNIFRKDLKEIEEFVTIGDCRTSLFLIDGNGYRKYAPETLSARYFDGTPDSPEDIADRISEKEKDMEAARESGNQKVWDGIGVGLRSYTILRDPAEEFLGLNVDFYKSRYAQFQATVATIGKEDRSDTHSIYARHIAGKSPRDVVPYLARHVGIAALIITKDDVLIVTKRDENTGARPGEFDVSVVEGIEPTKDADMSGEVNKIDVFRAVMRGCEEEMGFRPSLEEVSILGFGVDMQWYQFNFLAIVKTRLTYQEILENRNGRAKDSWETRVVPKRRNVDDVLKLINNEKMWGFASVLLYWSLLDGSTRANVEARAAQIVKKPE